jgi:hypothetical protein
MPFSEQQKLQIKRRAHFRCCLCHDLGVEIHHIIPQAEGGPDIEDNAAPVCPTCHEKYGDNPKKRKFIREARDFWYELCDQRYLADPHRLDEITKLLEKTASKDDLFVAFQKIVDTISSWKQTDAQDADEELSIPLPTKYWVVILASLDMLVKTSKTNITTLREQGFTPERLKELPDEYITALAGPIIARSMIIEPLAEKGIMTKEAGERLGKKFIQNLIDKSTKRSK